MSESSSGNPSARKRRQIFADDVYERLGDRRIQEVGLGKQHLILIQPESVHLVVCRAKQWLSLASAPLRLDDDNSDLGKALSEATEPIRKAVDQHGIRGPIGVLYHSDTQSIEMIASDARTDGEAIEGARLSCMSSLNYTSDCALAEATVVGRDRTGDSRKRHVVVVAEHRDVAKVVCDWTMSLGLSIAFLTPKPAAVLTGYLKRVLQDTQHPCGWLYIGEHTAFFVLAENGRIFFQRRIDVGLSTLVQSLTSPLRLPTREEPFSLTKLHAHTLLHQTGIPDRDAWIDEAAGIRGVHLLPLLQPVLQRIIVELRQSFRFGITDEQREALKLLVTGPGAAVRGLSELLSEGLDVQSEIDPRFATAVADNQVGVVDDRTEDDGGQVPELLDAAAQCELIDISKNAPTWKLLSVLSADLLAKRTGSRMRRCLVGGVCAAMLLIAFDHQHFAQRLDAAEQERRDLQVENEDVDRIRDISEKMSERRATLPILKAAISNEVGFRVDYQAVLGEVTHITPSGVRLVGMDFNADNGRTSFVLTGDAVADETGGTELAKFIDRLNDSPLFDGVVLREVKTAVFANGRGETFELVMQAVEVPSTEAKFLKETKTLSQEGQ